MPVRNIPISNRAVTGRHAKSGARYESALERDYYELISADPDVINIDWQPVSISYTSIDGKTRRYTPDALITFKENPVTKITRPPLLIEVKYREEYRKNFEKFKERFYAARKFARDRGWRFKVMTDRDIRSQRLTNLRFLSGFKDRMPDPFYLDSVQDIFYSHQEISFQNLLYAIAGEDRWKQAAAIPTIWHLVANDRVTIDLSTPITPQTILRARE